jgi:hypothetical protein
MKTLISLILAILMLPIVLAVALLFALVFGAVGGGAGAVVAAWPILLYYHDRYLLAFIPASWTLRTVRRVQAYVDFHRDPNSQR